MRSYPCAKSGSSEEGWGPSRGGERQSKGGGEGVSAGHVARGWTGMGGIGPPQTADAAWDGRLAATPEEGRRVKSRRQTTPPRDAHPLSPPPTTKPAGRPSHTQKKQRKKNARQVGRRCARSGRTTGRNQRPPQTAVPGGRAAALRHTPTRPRRRLFHALRAGGAGPPPLAGDVWWSAEIWPVRWGVGGACGTKSKMEQQTTAQSPDPAGLSRGQRGPRVHECQLAPSQLTLSTRILLKRCVIPG